MKEAFGTGANMSFKLISLQNIRINNPKHFVWPKFSTQILMIMEMFVWMFSNWKLRGAGLPPREFQILEMAFFTFSTSPITETLWIGKQRIFYLTKATSLELLLEKLLKEALLIMFIIQMLLFKTQIKKKNEKIWKFRQNE